MTDHAANSSWRDLSPGKNPEESAEARRVKNFTSQRKFHAPAADDFIKGMLPDGQLPAAEPSAFCQFCAVMGSVAAAIKGLWQEAKPTSPDARKAD